MARAGKAPLVEPESEKKKSKSAPESLTEGHVFIRIEILCPVDEKVNKKVASFDFIELGDFNFNENRLTDFLRSEETPEINGVGEDSKKALQKA